MTERMIGVSNSVKKVGQTIYRLQWLIIYGVAIAVTFTTGSGFGIDAGSVSLSRVSRITPEASGNYSFFRLATAPDSPDSAIVCTLHTSPATNEASAELFSSMDAGETWALRIKDESSEMVSEDACAFGESGVAYFIAQPWGVRNPYALDGGSFGDNEMRLYRSSTNGAEWYAFLTAQFVDYTRLAVDSWPTSPFRGRAYVVGSKSSAANFSFLTVLDGGKRVVPAKPSEPLQNTGNSSQYPRSVIVLRSGTVLGSYVLATKKNGKIVSKAVVTISTDGGRTVQGPFAVEEDICPGVGAAVAENPVSRSVIALYGVREGLSCSPVLASSVDEGRTWTRVPAPIQFVENFSKTSLVQPGSITVRNDGTVFLTWIVDGDVYGSLISPSWEPVWRSRISSKSNAGVTNVAPYVRRDVRLSGAANADIDVSLQFGFTRYGEVESSAQSDGAVLVVWRERDGQLYSRSIQVVPIQSAGDLTAGPSVDVTALVRYKARDVRFNDDASAFDFDIALVNASTSALCGPFALRIRDILTTAGPAALDGSSKDGIVFSSPRNALLPGQHTVPAHVRILASQALDKVLSSSIETPRIALKGRIYAERIDESEFAPCVASVGEKKGRSAPSAPQSVTHRPRTPPTSVSVGH